MTSMRYKGFEAIIEFDEDSANFHGEVINLRDVITFEGRTVDELKAELAASVDDYLAFCASRGEDPEKPFTGQFVVRTDPDLHKGVSTAAKRQGISLNKFVTAALEKAVGG